MIVINIFFNIELQKCILDFDYSSKSSIEKRKDETEDSENFKDSEDPEDPEDEFLDFSNIIFDR